MLGRQYARHARVLSRKSHCLGAQTGWRGVPGTAARFGFIARIKKMLVYLSRRIRCSNCSAARANDTDDALLRLEELGQVLLLFRRQFQTQDRVVMLHDVA